MKKRNAFYRLNRMTLGEATVDDIVNFENDVKQALRENPVLRVGKRALRPKEEDFWQLRWEDLIEIRELIGKGDLAGVIKLLYRIDDKQLVHIKLLNFLSVRKWIVARLSEIRDREANKFSHHYTAEEKAAGIEDLEQFGEAVALDDLAGGDPLKYKKLLKKPYGIIFLKLCLNKTRNLIEKKLIENAGRKIRASH